MAHKINSELKNWSSSRTGKREGQTGVLTDQSDRPKEMKARLQVMKSGGTSVGDASCIARTAQIVAQAARENGCVAVVSAMSGVTNRLVEAAKNAQAGNNGGAAAVVDALRGQHEAALTSLIQREEERARIRQKMEDVLAEGCRLCEGTALLRELTPRTLDAISSLGERLSAPLVAAAVRELGVPRIHRSHRINRDGRVSRRRGAADEIDAGKITGASAATLGKRIRAGRDRLHWRIEGRATDHPGARRLGLFRNDPRGGDGCG